MLMRISEIRTVKLKIISVLGSSAPTPYQQRNKIIHHPDLGDQHPSALLNSMLSLRFLPSQNLKSVPDTFSH
jgi:hypothetical protein